MKKKTKKTKKKRDHHHHLFFHFIFFFFKGYHQRADTFLSLCWSSMSSLFEVHKTSLSGDMSSSESKNRHSFTYL